METNLPDKERALAMLVCINEPSQDDIVLIRRHISENDLRTNFMVKLPRLKRILYSGN